MGPIPLDNQQRVRFESTSLPKLQRNQSSLVDKRSNIVFVLRSPVALMLGSRTSFFVLGLPLPWQALSPKLLKSQWTSSSAFSAKVILTRAKLRRRRDSSQIFKTILTSCRPRWINNGSRWVVLRVFRRPRGDWFCARHLVGLLVCAPSEALHLFGAR